jgi:hypothetical protein
MTKGEESSALDGCQRADSVSSEMEIGYPTEEERRWAGNICPARGHAVSQRGGFEIAFDNENSYIIVEVIRAEIRRSVIDIGHEIRSRQ